MKIIHLAFYLFSGLIAFSQANKQTLEAPDMNFEHGENFDKGKVIIVIGDYCDSIEFYQKRIDRYKRRDSLVQVKVESKLDESDLNKNLYFYGLFNWYSNLNNFNLPVKKTNNGFKIEKNSYTDKLNAIWLVNSDETRKLYLGNSYEAFQDKGDWGAYDYFIINNGKRIDWGNLTENSFDSTRFINSLSERRKLLNENLSLEYLNIYYPSDLNADNSYFSELSKIKLMLDEVIGILQLKKPQESIQAYIYKDVIQKTSLTCHDGYGVAYPEWNEINVIFNGKGNNGVIIHESIHILFDNEIKNVDNSCLLSEGVVGYAMNSIESNNSNNRYAGIKELFNEPIEKWFDERINSGRDIPSSKLYPISTAWVSFLIEEYGMEKFKKLYSIPNYQLRYGYERIYSKTVDELTIEFKNAYN